MNQANRLILNTLVTYGRMALTVGIGLITTRLLLRTLGEVDFGLFVLLGGGLSLLMLISTALVDSAQRHMAYEIGRGDERALREIFSTSLVIYVALAAVVLAAGLALRPVVLTYLTIPHDRLRACGWVYDLTLFNILATVLSTPFLAVYVARQAMVQDAVFAAISSVLGLLAVVFADDLAMDVLIAYAVLVTAARIGVHVLQVLRSLAVFPESRFRVGLVRRRHFKELMGFASWSFLGLTGWQLRTQGGNILLNLFFGPTVNASFGVATQASVYMTNFSGVIAKASRPAMTTIEGAGGRPVLRELALTASKLTVLTSSLISVPVMLAPETCLRLWLGSVPPFADSFTVLIMGGILIAQVGAGHTLAIIALGDIGRVTRYMFGLVLLPLPIAAVIFLVSDALPPWITAVGLMTNVVSTAFNVWFIGRRIEVPLRQTLNEVVRPAVGPIVFGALAGWATQRALDGHGDLALFGGTGVVYAAVLLTAAWLFALTPRERDRLQRFGGGAWRRIVPAVLRWKHRAKPPIESPS